MYVYIYKFICDSFIDILYPVGYLVTEYPGRISGRILALNNIGNDNEKIYDKYENFM